MAHLLGQLARGYHPPPETTGITGGAMDPGQQRGGRPRPILRFIGAALTLLIGAGLLTTLLTIELEGRERDAALKGNLVQDISTTLARTSLTARFVVTGSYGVEEPNVSSRPSRLRQRYNEGQQGWEQAVASIRAQLQAYYKDPKIAEDWDDFATAFGRFYQLSQPPPAKGTSQRKRHLSSRRKWVAEIRSYMKDEEIGVSWERLAERTGGDSYAQDYETLSRQLLERQTHISKRILSLPTTNTPPVGRVYLWIKDLVT